MKYKLKKNYGTQLLFIMLTALFLGALYFVNQSVKKSQLTRGKADIYGNHNPDQLGLHEALVMSIVESGAKGSRFKLRVAYPEVSDGKPVKLKLTGIDNKILEARIAKTTSPFECYDSHNYNSVQAGYETGWVDGDLDNYKVEEIEIHLDSGNGLNKVNLPLSHTCIKFAGDVGETDMSGTFVFPVSE